MKKEYDFSKARRGAVVPSSKQRITIRLDADVIEYFKTSVEEAGGGNYQAAINSALREYITGARLADVVSEAVQKSVRRELHAANDATEIKKSA